MKKTVLVAAVAASIVCAAAHAQNKPIQSWSPPAHREMDPAKRLPETAPAAAPSAQAVPADAAAQAPSATPYAAQPVRSEGQAQLARTDDMVTSVPRAADNLGGFFVGVQGGKGRVYEGVDQSAALVNAGYRWQAGPVSLIGIEVARGRLSDTQEDGWRFDKVDFASIGANARFNFGVGNPVYGLVRAGYWAADTSVNDGDYRADLDGGYFGLGLGVDFSRNVNMSLTYTSYVYFNEYYWYEGELYYDANRADTLMLGIEARF